MHHRLSDNAEILLYNIFFHIAMVLISMFLTWLIIQVLHAVGINIDSDDDLASTLDRDSSFSTLDPASQKSLIEPLSGFKSSKVHKTSEPYEFV
jgi:hypothetical protein